MAGNLFVLFSLAVTAWAARTRLSVNDSSTYESCSSVKNVCRAGLCRVQMGCFELSDCKCKNKAGPVLLCFDGKEVPLSAECKQQIAEETKKKAAAAAAREASQKRAAASAAKKAEEKKWKSGYKWTAGPVAASRPFLYRKSSDSLNFLIIGDWGGSSDSRPVTGSQLATAKGMGIAGQTFGAQFVLGLGDNFYPSGVHAGNKWRLEESFNKVYTHSSLQVPWYHCAGNHDWAGKASIKLQIEYTVQSPRWVMPSAHYSFRKVLPSGKTLKFVMFDHLQISKNKKYTPLPQSAAKKHTKLTGVEWPTKFVEGGKAWEWLEHELATSKDDYIVLVDHHPVYTVCSHGDTSGLQTIPELMKKYRVTAFMSGHDHCAMTIHRDGQTYILQGAASQAWNQAVFKKKVEHYGGKVEYAVHRDNKRGVKGSFSTAEATDAGLTIRHHDHEGAVLHQMEPLSPRF